MGVLTEHKAHDCTPPIVPNTEASYMYDCDCGTRWQWQSAWHLEAGAAMDQPWWHRKRPALVKRIVVDGHWVLNKRITTDVVIGS